MIAQVVASERAGAQTVDVAMHAVVHVKTKTPMKMQSANGFVFPNDPFFEYFFGNPNQKKNKGDDETPMYEKFISSLNHAYGSATENEVLG